MIWMVLKDFSSGKWDALKKNKFNLMIYGGSAITILNALLKGKEVIEEQKWIALVQILFFIWSIVVYLSFLNRLSTPMFLVPLTKGEKERYLRTSYALKFFLVSGPHLVYNLGLVLLGRLVWWKGAAIVISLFFLGVEQGISTRIDLGHVKEEYLNDGKEVIFLLLSAVSYFISVRIEFQKMDIWEEIVLCLAFLGQIMLLPWIIKRHKVKMKAGMDYEMWKSNVPERR